MLSYFHNLKSKKERGKKRSQWFKSGLFKLKNSDENSNRNTTTENSVVKVNSEPDSDSKKM